MLETRTVILSRPSRLADYWECCKPGIAGAVLMTTLAGYLAGARYIGQSPDLSVLFHTLLSTGFAALGAGALNMLLESDLDALMDRTRNRPLPAGRVRHEEIFFLGMVLASLSIVHMAATTNLTSTFFTAMTLVAYLVLYTPMKKTGPWCTVVGAVSGALPPVIGWSAAKGPMDLGALSLFTLLFVWQFPHLLALAWLYREDYARAGFRFMPVQDPSGEWTAKWVFISTLALGAASVLPWALGLSGSLYLSGCVLLCAGLLCFAREFRREPTDLSARRLFLATVAYPPVLFLLLAFR